MNNRDRINAIIKGRGVDYLPSQLDFTPKQIENLCEAMGLNEDQLMEYVGNSIKYVQSLNEVYEYFNKDVHDEEMKQFAVDKGFARLDQEKNLVFDSFGVGWSTVSEGVSAELHPLEDLSNYSHYHFPVPSDINIMKYGKKTVEKYGEKYFLLGQQGIGLFERCWCLRGYENFMCDIMTDPDLVEDMLDNVLKYKLAEGQMYVDIGADAVRTGDDWGLQRNLQIRPELWRKYIKPRQERLYRFYKDAGLPTFQHSCGDISEIIPDLIEIGLDVLHPIQPLSMDINELSQKYGNNLVFWGGIDTQEALPFWKPQAVKEEVRRVFNILGRNGKYIMAPAQEIMSDVPIENLEALVEEINNCKFKV
jgi:uroporphyrinogen decarboxylase